MTRQGLIDFCLTFPAAYEDVTPAYHMNKVHWNTVIDGGDVPEDEIKRMVGSSYDLIKPKVGK